MFSMTAVMSVSCIGGSGRTVSPTAGRAQVNMHAHTKPSMSINIATSRRTNKNHRNNARVRQHQSIEKIGL